MELSERIKEAALLEFGERGVRFTMDDVSRRLGISKKTLYECVRDKESLLEGIVKDAFASIKAQERAIVEDPGLDAVERLRRVISIMPSFGAAFDLQKVGELEEQYPAIRELIESRIEADWEVTFGLYDRAVREGLLRKVDRGILREILFATMEQLLRDDFLERSGKSYEEAMGEVLDILFGGLLPGKGGAAPGVTESRPRPGARPGGRGRGGS